jgi:hypothetical protein
MTTPKEPREKPAETQHDGNGNETLSLVDYFDRMDREAFRRVIDDHDRSGPAVSGG